jgi:hypothetical protein
VLRIGLELGEAARAAEIIVSPANLVMMRSGRRIDHHSTDGIFRLRRR